MAASSQILLRVYLVDDTYKTVYVDPDNTTVEDLWAIMSDKLGLSPVDAECFFLWGISSEMEVLMFSDAKLSDVIDEWPSLKSELTPPPSFKPMATLKRTTTLMFSKEDVRSTSKINTATPARTFETLPGKPAPTLRRKSTLSVIPQYGSSETSHEPPMFKLVFRPTAVLPLVREMQAKSQPAIRLFYLQAVHNVISSCYPCDAALAIKLAGIQLHVASGDYNPDVHKPGFLVVELQKYVPEHLRKTRKELEWEQAIYAEHSRHAGKDKNSLMFLYLEATRRWRYYGSTFFSAIYVPTQQSFWKQPYQGQVIIGINFFGVHVIEPRDMKIASCPHERITWWESDRRNFSLQFVASTGLPQRLAFKTRQSSLINELLQDWAEEWGASEGAASTSASASASASASTTSTTTSAASPTPDDS
ncbi:26S proteasome non-ATPase regulatory subunit 8 [Pelomyxa schiedti]|nr:26S proteasome non-ATPase regulatory subunit 8 [Pelomyxa schiedti]